MSFFKGLVDSGKAAVSSVAAAGKDQLSEMACSNPSCTGGSASAPYKQKKIEFSIKASLFPCVTCTKLFCKNCLYKLENTHELDFENTGNSASSSGGDGGGAKTEATYEGKFVCSADKDAIVKMLMDKFSVGACKIGDACCGAYLADGERQKFLYAKPAQAKDESFKGKLALWGDTLLATTFMIAKAAGMATYAKAAYLLYQGSGVAGLVMDPKLFALLSPIAQRMEEDSAEEKAASGGKSENDESKAKRMFNHVVWAYYLSLVHLERNEKSIAHENVSSEEGMVNVKCPVELIDTLGEYMCAAKWLYFSLSSLHREDSLKWYLSKIVASQGWTVLTSTNQSVSFVDGSKNPAFCLAARNSPTQGKELIVSIRGSSEQTDWWINANESPRKISFEGIEGYVHGGMYVGILAILDCYGSRKQITDFVKRGYKVSVVGHSLGAGSAMICALELLNHFRREGIPNAETIVKAVAYATPAVVTENLAEKIAQLGWITSVYGNDVVPRISINNIKKLTKEVRDFAPTADKWYADDCASAKKVLAKAGKRDTDIIQTSAEVPTSDAEEIRPIVAGSAQTPAPKGIVLVPPGRIVYMTKRNASVGGYSASEITHRHAAMRSINLITDEMVEDHGLENYFLAIRGTRFMPIYAARPIVFSAETPPRTPDMSKPISCSICELDTTWPARFQNDSSRFACTKYCTMCRRAVCVVCAPAGDVVPEEGITNATITLSDIRIPLLSRGIPQTRRLCVHCYLDSYKVL